MFLVASFVAAPAEPSALSRVRQFLASVATRAIAASLFSPGSLPSGMSSAISLSEQQPRRGAVI